ncbi:metal-binding protein [Chitinophaga lutea]|uniref:Metal-binding protein n=1 Tax=Chitinophaga lutea TaxID=2488634 RepID=A0A3N4PJ21_9BACT|nr:Ada metal-binding domain-containing protein [Chitinophaga lutea]RPE08673.1 metal-binding protein [Chitinophaga lutea]
MYHHIELGNNNENRHRKLSSLIRAGAVTLGGYKKGGIYGLLHCRSGKRMKVENRVFFTDENEALAHGYRPCGACLPEKYRQWKASKKRVERGH